MNCFKLLPYGAISFPLLFVSLLLLSSPNLNCLGGQVKRDKPSISLSWNKKIRRLAILVKELGCSVRVQPRGSYPYSHNASGGVWIGVDFPYEKAISMILWSRNYYLELRYLALSDYASPTTNRYDKDLFIGGATRKALKLQLEPWLAKDFNKLKKIKTKAQFHHLIRSKYPKVKKTKAAS